LPDVCDSSCWKIIWCFNSAENIASFVINDLHSKQCEAHFCESARQTRPGHKKKLAGSRREAGGAQQWIALLGSGHTESFDTLCTS
jgi:hypothetical protein